MSDEDDQASVAPLEDAETLPAWLKQAHTSARIMVTRWIRSVLREVCFQVLKKRWSPSVDDNQVLHLVITQEDLDACHEACRRVGTKWSQKLRQQGQTQVAQWVDQIVASERFWENPDQELEEEPQEQESSRVDNSAEEEDIGANLSTSSLAVTRLQGLGGGTDAKQHIRAIDSMARRGQTSWPYDWSLIQKAAVNNTKRLHSETLRGRPRIARAPVEYEIVSRNGESNQQQQQVVNSQEMPYVIKRYLELKGAPARSNKRQRVETPPSEELAREASGLGLPEKWSWKENVVGSFSPEELGELEKNALHPENDDTPKNTVLGAMKDLGHVHYCLKNHVVMDSAKKQKRAFRRAQKERLGPNSEEREVREPKSRWTKAVRVVNNQAMQQQEHCIELDLGECLVELDTPGGERSLCAFSSLEVSLKDEEKASSRDSSTHSEA